MNRMLIAALVAPLCGCGLGTSGTTGSNNNTQVTATGSLSGAMVGSVAKVVVTTVGSTVSSPRFQIGIQGDLKNSSEVALTTPAPSTIDSGSFTVVLAFDSVVGAGTYTAASPSATANFGSLVSFTTTTDSAGVSSVGSYAGGKLSQDASNSLTLKLDSVTLGTSGAGVELYAAHGSVDTSMPGGTITNQGMSTKTDPVTLHLDF